MIPTVTGTYFAIIIIYIFFLIKKICLAKLQDICRICHCMHEKAFQTNSVLLTDLNL